MCHHVLPDSLLTAGLAANTLRYGPTRETIPAAIGESQASAMTITRLDRTETGGLTKNLVRTVSQKRDGLAK